MANNRRSKCEDASGLHRYRRFESINGKPLWKCLDCSSFTYNMTHIIGARARCYVCKVEYKITQDTLQYAKLRCRTDDCLGTLREDLKEQIGIPELTQFSDDVAKAKRLAILKMAYGDDLKGIKQLEEIVDAASEDEEDEKSIRSILELQRDAVAKALESSSESEQDK